MEDGRASHGRGRGRGEGDKHERRVYASLYCCNERSLRWRKATVKRVPFLVHKGHLVLVDTSPP